MNVSKNCKELRFFSRAVQLLLGILVAMSHERLFSRCRRQLLGGATVGRCAHKHLGYERAKGVRLSVRCTCPLRPALIVARLLFYCCALVIPGGCCPADCCCLLLRKALV